MEIRVDGRPCACEPGELLLAVAERNGVEIPTLCHHEGLPGQGCCRVCIVELDGRVVPACVTRLEGPCAVRTDSEKIREERGVVLALLRSRAPESEEIAALAARWGAPELDRLEPLEDGARCVLCGLCVRACRSLGTGAIATVLRGTRKRVSTPYGAPSAACIGCGSCAAVCPTGAISLEEADGVRRIWERAFQLLRCEGCGAVMGTAELLAHACPDRDSAQAVLCVDCRRERVGGEVAVRTLG